MAPALSLGAINSSAAPGGHRHVAPIKRLHLADIVLADEGNHGAGASGSASVEIPQFDPSLGSFEGLLVLAEAAGSFDSDAYLTWSAQGPTEFRWRSQVSATLSLPGGLSASVGDLGFSAPSILHPDQSTTGSAASFEASHSIYNDPWFIGTGTHQVEATGWAGGGLSCNCSGLFGSNDATSMHARFRLFYLYR